MIASFLVALLVAANPGRAPRGACRAGGAAFRGPSRSPALFGIHGLAWLAKDHLIESLAELGVILLPFEVGLATRLADLVKVGVSAFLVALIGVVAPMLLGFGMGLWLLPGRPPYVLLFLGATLCATSVGTPPACSRTWDGFGHPRARSSSVQR